MVDDLEQQVPEFVGQGGHVAPGDGVGDLVGFFDRVGRDGVEGLRLVPRATCGGVAERGHEVEQAGDLLLGFSLHYECQSRVYGCGKTGG